MDMRPASLGTALQQHWPLVRMKLMSFLSSSAVHGPFFNPTLSQHGCLPILINPPQNQTQPTKAIRPISYNMYKAAQ